MKLFVLILVVITSFSIYQNYQIKKEMITLTNELYALHGIIADPTSINIVNVRAELKEAKASLDRGDINRAAKLIENARMGLTSSSNNLKLESEDKSFLEDVKSTVLEILGDKINKSAETP